MFKERFKELRTDKSLSQKRIAEKLGVSQDLVYKWEKGLSSPDPQTLYKIANTLDVSADYLIGRSNIMSPLNSQLPSGLQCLLSEAEGLSPESIEEIRKYAQLVKLKEKTDKAKDAEISLGHEGGG